MGRYDALLAQQDTPSTPLMASLQAATVHLENAYAFSLRPGEPMKPLHSLIDSVMVELEVLKLFLTLTTRLSQFRIEEQGGERVLVCFVQSKDGELEVEMQVPNSVASWLAPGEQEMFATVRLWQDGTFHIVKRIPEW